MTRPTTSDGRGPFIELAETIHRRIGVGEGLEIGQEVFRIAVALPVEFNTLVNLHEYILPGWL